jgi:hypothetical protein
MLSNNKRSVALHTSTIDHVSIQYNICFKMKHFLLFFHIFIQISCHGGHVFPCLTRHNEDFFAEDITNLIHAKFGSNWSHSLSGDEIVFKNNP